MSSLNKSIYKNNYVNSELKEHLSAENFLVKQYIVSQNSLLEEYKINNITLYKSDSVDEYSKVLDRVEQIIKDINRYQLNEIIDNKIFKAFSRKNINKIEINFEKTMKNILISFALEQVNEDNFDDILFFDELDPFIVKEMCIHCKLPFDEYLKYSKLFKKCFFLFIDRNYIFDEWGFFSLTNDKEQVQLTLKEEFFDNFNKAKNRFIENSENIIEEVDF